MSARQSVTEVLDEVLATATQGKRGVTVVLAAFDEDDKAPTYRSLSISKDAAQGFIELVDGRLARVVALKRSGDLRLRQYDADYKADAFEIESAHVASPTSLEDGIATLIEAIPSPDTIPFLGDDDSFVDSVRFYVLFVTTSDGPLVLLRRYGRTKELSRSKNLIMRMIGDSFDRLTDLTFVFDPEFDAIVYQRFVFVLNKENFHHIFRHREHLVRVAEESLKIIKRHVPIDGFDAFRGACLRHQQKLQKLRSISRKPYLKQLTVAVLEKTIKKFKRPIQLMGKGADRKLVFNEAEPWEILRLLDDGFLESEMTKTQYEVNSKTPL